MTPYRTASIEALRHPTEGTVYRYNGTALPMADEWEIRVHAITRTEAWLTDYVSRNPGTSGVEVWYIAPETGEGPGDFAVNHNGVFLRRIP